MKRLLSVALLAVSVALPASAQAATTADPVLAGTHHGRVTKTWSLDGDFTASPAAKGNKPLITEAAALRLARASLDELRGAEGGFLEKLVVGYGLVTVKDTVKHDTDVVPNATGKPVFASFHHRPAWIIADVFDGIYACPSPIVSTPGHPAPVYAPVASLHYNVLAIDAMTGKAAIDFFEPGNEPCFGNPFPATVSIPMLHYSIPFTREAMKAKNGDAVLSYVVPSCAVEDSAGGGGSGDTATIQILVLEPFNTPAHCKPAYTDSIDYGHGFAHFIQAPLGLVTRNGTTPLPKPKTSDV